MYVGGSHIHTEYVDDHEISDVREEFGDKIKALEITMLGVLSLFKQVYSITGKLMDICIYCEVESPALFSCMDKNRGKSINVYVCM